jgi:hypothetical protein
MWPTAHHSDQRTLDAFLSNTPAIVANPFDNLADALGNDELKNASEKLSNAPRLTAEELGSRFKSGIGDGGPPEKAGLGDDAPDDAGDGAAFIQIHIAVEGEGGKFGGIRRRTKVG